MRVIDMFIHPVAQASEADLFDLSELDWPAWTAATLAAMDRDGIAASGVCLMDEGILDRPGQLRQLAAASATGRFWFTLMPDFRRVDAAARVEQAACAGFRGLTFHSYLQRITPADHGSVIGLARQAEACGMYTGLCTAYGSKRMFTHQNLPLAAEVADAVSGPVLLHHNGGARVIDAMLMCEMWPNLFLETSFSLSYWVGSSVDMDLAFAIRKLGAERVFFGSDAPFVTAASALRDHELFFDRQGFGDCERRLILGDAARAVFSFLPTS